MDDSTGLGKHDRGRASELRAPKDVADYGNVNVPSDALGEKIAGVHFSFNRKEIGDQNYVEGGVRKVMKSGDVD
jgi:hypothetical protein